MRNRRSTGGVDSRTDFGNSLSDEELARRLQAAEFSPEERPIDTTPRPIQSSVPSQLLLEEERARTRNANLLRQKAEENLRAQKALLSAKSTFSIPIYSDNRFDRLYTWSMDLIPDFEYVRQVRLRRLIEDLIRSRLRLGEPEYLLKDEIKRLIYEAIHDSAPTKKPSRRKASKKKLSKKKAPTKKTSKKKSSARRLTTR